MPEQMAPPLALVTTAHASARSAYDIEVTDTLPPRMAPPLTDLNRPFWTGGANGELLILRCQDCQRWAHPPRERCSTCDGALIPRPVSGRGSVFTFTINRHPFNPEVPVPYVIAIVELAEQPGLRFTTDLVECDIEEVHIGMPVEVLFEQAGEAWVPLFRPVR
jgi:uncharacterized OB-fold protein